MCACPYRWAAKFEGYDQAQDGQRGMDSAFSGASPISAEEFKKQIPIL